MNNFLRGFIIYFGSFLLYLKFVEGAEIHPGLTTIIFASLYYCTIEALKPEVFINVNQSSNDSSSSILPAPAIPVYKVRFSLAVISSNTPFIEME